jgi:hypothetical protein
MKKGICLLTVGVALCIAVSAQQSDVVFLEPQKTQQSQVGFNPVSGAREERTSINVGVLMGGGGLVGADLEFLVINRAGLQFGAGLGSMGFGVNYHFKPYINSQFVSVQYFQQGFGENKVWSLAGPMYVFRAKKIFQAGIGFGTVVSTGPRYEEFSKGKEISPVQLLYNIGLYFPL